MSTQNWSKGFTSPPLPSPLRGIWTSSAAPGSLGCELTRPSNESGFYLSWDAKRCVCHKSSGGDTHIRTRKHAEGFMPRLCSVSPPPLLQRLSLTFKKRALQPLANLRRKTHCWFLPGAPASFRDSSQGKKKHKNVQSVKGTQRC